MVFLSEQQILSKAVHLFYIPGNINLMPQCLPVDILSIIMFIKG